MTGFDWTLLFAFISLSGVVAFNSYRFSKESSYLKKKYKDAGYEKGYAEGYSEGYLDGINFIDDILPPPPPLPQKKKRWRRK